LGYNETCGFWDIWRGCGCAMAKAHYVDFIPPRLEYVTAATLMILRLEPLSQVLHAALPHADPRFSRRI